MSDNPRPTLWHMGEPINSPAEYQWSRQQVWLPAPSFVSNDSFAKVIAATGISAEAMQSAMLNMQSRLTNMIWTGEPTRPPEREEWLLQGEGFSFESIYSNTLEVNRGIIAFLEIVYPALEGYDIRICEHWLGVVRERVRLQTNRRTITAMIHEFTDLYPQAAYGPAHAVLDDYNLDDHHIQWTMGIILSLLNPAIPMQEGDIWAIGLYRQISKRELKATYAFMLKLLWIPEADREFDY